VDRLDEALRTTLARNSDYAATFDATGVDARPRRRLAVLACMDARLHVEEALGLRTGDAHVIRNGGGLATDDAIRSLVISQHLLGTREVFVIGHTRCGMLDFREDEVRAELVTETGRDAGLPLLPFDDLEASVRRSVAVIAAHPWIRADAVHGLVFDVDTGLLRRVA
jgi:carbonic anhydrase